ncbi:unnamed protein product [Coffea canephora]|uniref:Uncharacterized protein n=1 Tax=Coffea canephora TaxID=49390 RepID=A0A068U2B4_COFCA|nr:unnamed protein product [Coffea canephora]
MVENPNVSKRQSVLPNLFRKSLGFYSLSLSRAFSCHQAKVPHNIRPEPPNPPFCRRSGIHFHSLTISGKTQYQHLLFCPKLPKYLVIIFSTTFAETTPPVTGLPLSWYNTKKLKRPCLPRCFNNFQVTFTFCIRFH